MVKRAVIQLVTLGTNVDIKAGAAKSNNYITAVMPHAAGYAFAYADVSTGELKVTDLKQICSAKRTECAGHQRNR